MTQLSVADRLAIEDLFARYSWALDTGDPDALVATFAPDGKIVEEVFEDADVWEGHAGVRALGEHYRSSPHFPGRQHHAGMPLYEPVSDELCRVRSFVFVTECHGEPPFVLRFTGYYEDELVKREGRWLFLTRVIRLWNGEVLSRFPGKGERTPLRRPADLVVQRRTVTADQ